MTAVPVQQHKDFLEAEVPQEIIEQFKLLSEAIKKNENFAHEFLLNSSTEELQSFDSDISKVSRLLKHLNRTLHKERIKNHDLSERTVRDGRMAEQVNKSHEKLTKNPQLGRAQAVEYMHTIACEHERSLLQNEANIVKIEQTLNTFMDNDKEYCSLTERDLSNHIKRFDEIFGVVSSQMCANNEEIETLKETFLEQQRKIYGRYVRNPFKRKKDRQKMTDAFSNLKGLDAFPSQNAVLSMSEFLPKPTQTAAPSVFGISQNAGINGPLVGTSQPIFGLASAAPTNKSLFSAPTNNSVSNGNIFNFNTPQVAVATTQQAPIFGGTATPAFTNPLGTTFGNTLNSVSGTLFSGSVPTSNTNQGLSKTKTLFGSK